VDSGDEVLKERVVSGETHTSNTYSRLTIRDPIVQYRHGLNHEQGGNIPIFSSVTPLADLTRNPIKTNHYKSSNACSSRYAHTYSILSHSHRVCCHSRTSLQLRKPIYRAWQLVRSMTNRRYIYICSGTQTSAPTRMRSHLSFRPRYFTSVQFVLAMCFGQFSRV
jgi:hypothetical protein